MSVQGKISVHCTSGVVSVKLTSKVRLDFKMKIKSCRVVVSKYEGGRWKQQSRMSDQVSSVGIGLDQAILCTLKSSKQTRVKFEFRDTVKGAKPMTSHIKRMHKARSDSGTKDRSMAPEYSYAGLC